MRAETDVRKALDRHVRAAVPDAAWAYFAEEGYVRDVLTGDLSIRELADLYRRYVQAFSGRPERHRSDTEVSVRRHGDQLELRGRLLAQRAAEDETVREFRRRHLADGLVPLDDMVPWIQRQAEIDGAPTRWAYCVLADDGSALRPDEPDLWDHKILEYAEGLPEKDKAGRLSHNYIARVPTAHGGVLEELRDIARHLATMYDWRESLAVLFVLTGETPPLHDIFVSRWWSPGPPEQSRVILSIDTGTPAAEVATIYRLVRSEFRPTRVRASRRSRTELIEFVEARSALSWKNKFAEWNKDHETEAYTAVGNMQRDYKRALQLAGETDVNHG